jgi:hypothetical protein
MRETISAYRARTGKSYTPSSAGRPLGDDESCPTLFRYPGAGALLEALSTRLARLGPPGAETLWLCEDPTVPAPGGAGRFGALAVLAPLALGAARVADGLFAAVNCDVDPEAVIWIPPRLVAAGPAPWEAVASARDAEQALGESWHEERALAVSALSSYLEELDLLSRAGAPPLPHPWCELDDETRRRMLAVHGVTPRWTAPGR